jgi:hypothetical protein
MGLFTNLFPAKAPAAHAPAGQHELVYLMDTGKYEIEILGEVPYQATLEVLAGPRRPQGVKCYEKAFLKLEDHNAIRVEIQRQAVGYLSPEMTSFIRQQLTVRGRPQGVVECPAVIRGGWVSSDGRTAPYKVSLDLPRGS